MDINSKKLQELRDAMHWSQDELATAAGLSLRTIQRAERESVASLQTIKALASALQIDAGLLRPPKNDPVLPSVHSVEPAANKRRPIWVAIATLAVAAVIALLLIKPSKLMAFHFGEKPLAEKILGHWESSTSGRVMTFDMDGKATNTRGAVNGGGGSIYSLEDDVITFGFRNQKVSMRVTFDSAGEMDWTGVNTGYTAHYTRKKIVMPSRDTVYRAIAGEWRGTGDIDSLIIDQDRLKMKFTNGRVIDTPLHLLEQQVTVRGDGFAEQYSVLLDSPNQMTWGVVYTPNKYVFTRVKND